jgi:hypothetical protein
VKRKCDGLNVRGNVTGGFTGSARDGGEDMTVERIIDRLTTLEHRFDTAVKWIGRNGDGLEVQGSGRLGGDNSGNLKLEEDSAWETDFEAPFTGTSDDLHAILKFW